MSLTQLFYEFAIAFPLPICIPDCFIQTPEKRLLYFKASPPVEKRFGEESKSQNTLLLTICTPILLNVVNSLNNLALLYHRQGKYSQAKPLFIKALNIFEQHLGAAHQNTVTARQNVAYLRELKLRAILSMIILKNRIPKASYTYAQTPHLIFQAKNSLFLVRMLLF